MIRIFQLKQRVRSAVLLAVLMAPSAGVGEELDWAALTKEAPAGLLEVAESKRSALFFAGREYSADGKKHVSPFVGFFISADGLALCPLEPFCWERVPEFRTGDEQRTVLKTPRVLGIFADEELVLVKFAHKPKVFLTVSKELAQLGSWVAILSPSFAPGPTLGPILAHRRYTFRSRMKIKRKPEKSFSIAVPSRLSEGDGVVVGSPVVDASGEVVATYAASVKMPAQTFTLATPAAGLAARIDQAVKEGRKFQIPIPIAEQPYDPVIYCQEYLAGSTAESDGDFERALNCAKAVVAKFPDSRYAKIWQFQMVSSRSLDPLLQAKLLEGIKISEEAPGWERGIYHFYAGATLLEQGKHQEAIVHLQKSDELYPDGMACGTLLTIFQRMGRLKEAERYARRATKYEPDRINYWDLLQGILFAQGKSEGTDDIQDRVFLLEDLY